MQNTLINLTTCSNEDVHGFAHHMFQELTYNRPATFEEAAQHVVRNIYDTFANQFALVRIFRLMRHEELLPELQLLTNDGYNVTLMASYGDEDSWKHRLNSKSYKVLGITDALERPMFNAAFSQIGLAWGDDVEADDIMNNHLSMTKYFYVEHAAGNEYITHQGNFVEPYGIKSVLAIGSSFVSQEAYIMIAFSKTYLDTTAARAFAEMTPHVSTILARYDSGDVFWR